MALRRVLFIAQEISPYVAQSPMATMGRLIPQSIQEKGCEIRTFLPKWGNINERRNQLHEVIRLSGLNVIINDTDHPLLIKVASLQAAKMQVYFIDNEDYFQKRLMTTDKKGVEYDDNYERAIFYARSVIESIKKQRWYPDVIHCQGWIAGFVPFYIKTAYKDEPSFANSKVVYSLYNQPLTKPIPEDFENDLAFRTLTPEAIRELGVDFKQERELVKFAIQYSDGVIESNTNIPAEWLDYARSKGVAVLPYEGEEGVAQRYSDFYDQLTGTTDE